jgi:uncharacterized protein involved in cysteine biosynthesis
MDDRSEPLARFDRLKATLLVLKTLAVVAAVFVLLRLAAPNLMNTHNDVLFWLGVLCWPAAGLLVLWAGAWITRDIAALRRHVTVLPPLKRRPGAKGKTP